MEAVPDSPELLFAKADGKEVFRSMHLQGPWVSLRVRIFVKDFLHIILSYVPGFLP
jgi:hypothetical protein